MDDATNDITPARRRRAKQAGAPLLVRLQPALLDRLIAWMDTQADTPSRPEAIRRLLAAELPDPRLGESISRMARALDALDALDRKKVEPMDLGAIRVLQDTERDLLVELRSVAREIVGYVAD